MSVLQIAILAVIAILINRLKQGRSLALLFVSALVIYWLQPYQIPLNLIFWFPTWTLVLTVVSWLVTSVPEERAWKKNWAAVAVLIGVVFLVDVNRYIRVDYVFIVDTPRIHLVIAAVLGVLAVGLLLARVRKYPSVILGIAVAGLIAVLVLLKTPSVLTKVFEIVAGLRGKDASVASEFSWLGFSYVAFRLIHTILDRLARRVPSVSLVEYVNYVIFFPAFTAGPIDRIQRFNRSLNEPMPMNENDWMYAGTRLFTGLFKKFVIADGLAWFTLTDLLAGEVQNVGWLWFFLYAYSLRIYFDFSGYTDIAIGLGSLMGIRLPENFNSPYFKPNLTQFWNTWHMTLTQWFRSYFFNPLTRAMRSTKRPLPQGLMILLAQVSTMVLIGLWHGVTLGFVAWGLWHGLGLFIHNRWNEWMRTRQPDWTTTQRGAAALKYSGVFLTFHFVTLGWLFFFLPDPFTAWTVMLRLFGVT